MLRRRALGWLALLALIGVVGLSLWAATREGRDRYAETGLVTRVVDGDTIKVRLDSGGEDTVRLIGIDTPETFRSPECGGEEATENMRRLAEGKRVTLTPDPSQARRDRYDRRLDYVTLKGGQSLELAQLRAGWAEVFVYRDSPFQRVDRYRDAESAARSRHRGIWRICGDT